MRLPSWWRKVFDWGIRFGIMAVVVFGLTLPAAAQDKPEAKKKAEKGKVVEEGQAGDEEDSGVIEIVVKIPKPEALIFSQRMKTKYQTIGYEKSFLGKIIDSAKHSPF
ncbi:MAG: hypothetical protein FJ109_09660 [Deltaproteobacteria bacterium]|nr:hypothetical protein [Deltaproteobacteria bacterium]